MSEAIETLDAGQRETCAKVDFLSYLCVVCGKPYPPRRKDQKTCGQKACRHGAPRLAIRKAQHEAVEFARRERRRTRALTEYRLYERGTQCRDNYKESNKLVKDKKQQFSKCEFCKTPFEALSGFAFCGETAIADGACKKAYYEARPNIVAPVFGRTRFASHLDLHQARLFEKPGKGIPQSKTNFCPRCKEYVNQIHECKA